MTKVKILGISASPRKANTDLAVREALSAAESLGFAEGEFVALRDYDLKPCTGCMKCFGWVAPADDEWQCYEHQDDSRILVQKLGACDGLILGSPVYATDVTALARIFMEKTPYGFNTFTRWSGRLRNKPVGAITVGGADIEGQEFSAMCIWRWALRMNMLPVGSPPTLADPQPTASVSGGMLSAVDARHIYGATAITKESTRTVPPTQGARNMRSARNLGRNVATVAQVVKAGTERLAQEGVQLPETFSFRRYSVRPKEGSYIDRLVKEGKVQLVLPEKEG